VAKIRERNETINVLINNAGNILKIVVYIWLKHTSERKEKEKKRKTKDRLLTSLFFVAVFVTDRRINTDNIELSMAVNSYGPFLLSVMLVPNLRRGAPSRVINVNCNSHRKGNTIPHTHTHTHTHTHNHTITLSHYHTITLSHYHTITLSHYHTITQSQ
jgi:NAD(P)-dependent dehydrogenase (short-subunit alcohol dehydrogenase family)